MSESSSSAEVDFLDLCENNVRRVEALVLENGENLLNHRQCGDLSSKLSQTTPNIRELVLRCGTSVALFRPVFESLYRYLCKAEVLVSQCAEEDWCAAAVFQCQNENAFREILLDVGLCYNAIYELAKSKSEKWNDTPEDLRQSAAFKPTSGSDVDGDRQELQRRLDDLANGYTNMKGWESWMPWKVVRKQSLAGYLLRKMCYTLSEAQANTLDRYDAILWSKASEPLRTWGNSSFLGGGATEGGVCKTEWLGVPCARKEFHAREFESFFLKEAGILAHLKHPSIINFVCCGSGQKRGDRFIAMELMEMNLFDLIEEQKLKGVHFAVPVAVDMMAQIARGMCYSHGRGVAHRDLKPQNVVVSRLSTPHLSDDFCVKLVDFGASKIKVEASKSNTMTALGIGTTTYRAPEAHPLALSDGGRKVSWLKADAFSFAMTCAHLLSLEVPFEGTSSKDLYEEVTKNGQRPKVPDKYPRDLVTLLEDCWRTSPRLRPSFVEICARLETFRHRYLRKYTLSSEGSQVDEGDCRVGDEYIKSMLEEESSNERPLDDEAEQSRNIGIINSSGCFVGAGTQDETSYQQVPILPCSHGHALEHLPQPPAEYRSTKCLCDMCWKDICGDVYHCDTCQFDAHPDCVEIRDEMKVFFHDHPLHLLVRNYYSSNVDAICYICKELLQHSDWVYRCELERCDLDVHALCAKYPREVMRDEVHPHPLTLTEYLPEQSLACKFCSGEVRTNTWSYTCIQKWCPFDLHPHCFTLPWVPLCIFDGSHRLRLVRDQRGFHCSRCGAPGFLWFYHCKDCDVDIHLDCLHDMEEVDDGWTEACERFMLEYATKDDRGKMVMITQLLEKLPGGDALQASPSSTSSSAAGTMRKQPTIRRLASSKKLSLDAFDDAKVRRKIVAGTAERKAKRMAAKEETSNLKARSALEMFGKMESLVQDMQCSKSMSQADAEVLASTLGMLAKRKYSAEEEMATQVQSKMRHGPRTCLFYQDKYDDTGVYELLVRLAADMQDVWVNFLCEEPGHEHFVPFSDCLFCDEALDEEGSEKLQPLLAAGLQVVSRAVGTRAGQLPQLDSVELPNLGPFDWDLRAIDVEKHGKVLEDKENVEELKRAEDSAAEWILDDLDRRGAILYEDYGLLRVRYKETEVGNSPGYTRGSLGWLCTDHFNCGLKSGILQAYPLKYHNPKLN